MFLNCPFDDKFAPLFHASVLTIAALGFTPRCDSPPAFTPKAILEAYPKLVELLEAAKTEGLGHLTWPVIVKNVERVLTAMTEPAIEA